MAISGPLPLLHTLKINADLDGPDVVPALPLFENATNLKNFVFRVGKFESLPHFAFPNLTTLDLLTCTSTYPVSELLDCLEASPAL